MTFANGDKIYHVELNNMVDAQKRNGVLSGLEITEYGTPSMILNVSAGQCHVDNETYSETATTTVTMSTAHAIHPRIDIVCYDTSAGAAAVTVGTAAATPIPPDIPADDILLAIVNIPANDTTIENSQIIDERIFVCPIGLIYTASDTLVNSDDAEENHGITTYSNQKEFDALPDDLFSNDSEFRIKFDLKTANFAVTVYGRIYRNGVAVGTERSTTSTSYVNYSEDISGWSAGDLIQLYTRTTSFGIVVYAQNFRVYGDFESKSVFGW